MDHIMLQCIFTHILIAPFFNTSHHYQQKVWPPHKEFDHKQRCNLVVMAIRNGDKREHLAGSVSGACNSWSWGHEFESHIGQRACFKKKNGKGSLGWLSQLSLQLFILAQVMISESWNQAPHWALHWVQSPLVPLPLLLPPPTPVLSLSLSPPQINIFLKKEKKMVIRNGIK